MAREDAFKQEGFRHLVRIANTDLNGSRNIGVALTAIKGIGQRLAGAVLTAAEIDRNKKTGILTDEEIHALDSILKAPERHLPVWMLNRRRDNEDGTDKHLITTNLLFAVDTDLRNMKKLRTYKGIRHALGLPVRGQRTRSNFRRNKGKSLGVKKKKAE